MRRREFITLIGGAAAWPLAARAQQAPMPVIGFLHSTSAETWTPFVAGFRAGLREAGFVEGRDVAVEYRWAEDQPDLLPALAADLVAGRRTHRQQHRGQARRQERNRDYSDRVHGRGAIRSKLGLVASLNRPGRNVTGVTLVLHRFDGEASGDPAGAGSRADVIGCLLNPRFPGIGRAIERNWSGMRRTPENASVFYMPAPDARSTSVSARSRMSASMPSRWCPVRSSRPIENKSSRSRHSYAIPSIYTERVWPKAGGLMSYASSAVDAYRRAGVYAGRILKGETPANLPVDQSTKFELVINLKTAKALGLDVPPTLLARADEVIE